MARAASTLQGLHARTDTTGDAGDFGSGLTRADNTGVIDQHIDMPMTLRHGICRRSNR
jgi:hypothetical protein